MSRYQQALKRLVAALDLLELSTDDGPCTFDHHGTCQAHWGSGETEDGQCGNAAARALLDEERPGWWSH
jgi:hypothetical protein